MDRSKALALSVSLTGVIAAATAALALNFGLIGARAAPAVPTAAVAPASAPAAAPTPAPTRTVTVVPTHEVEPEGGEDD